MFINCRHCRALVATDPVSDLPPLRCPRCRGVLRADTQAPTATPSVAQLLRPAAVDPDDAAQCAAPVVPAAVVDKTPPSGLPSAGESVVAAPEVVSDASAPALEASTPADSDSAPVPATPTATSTTLPAVASDTEAPHSASQPLAVASASTPIATRASPSFARPARGVHGSNLQQRWLMATAAALALLLALQVLLADRARLAGDPGWRPLLVSICGVLRCALPPWHEPTALTLLARDVRPDPATPGQLLISAMFRNDADWPQAWPRVVLTLSDLNGHVIGTRAFAPAEYLASPTDTEVLDAGQSAAIRLSIVEPAVPAVSFAFEFR